MSFLNAKEIDLAYKTHTALWGLEPNKYLKEILNGDVQFSSALDIGCGTGRNSIYMAKRGIKVSALDISSSGIEMLNKLSSKCGVEMELINESILDHDLKGREYDFSVCMGTLHLFFEKDGLRVIEKLKESIKRGGHGFVTLFSATDVTRNDNPQGFYPTKKHLEELFTNVKILRFGNYDKHETHGAPHTHNINTIYFQKI